MNKASGLILLAFCLATTSLTAEKMPPYIPIVHKLRADAIKTLSQRHHMRCVGCGGAMMNSVEWIELVFQVKRPLSREEAREILVDAVEEIRQRVNSNEQLRPFLDTFPADHRIAHIGLWVSDAKGNDVYAPMIGQACVVGGPVVYWQHLPGEGGKHKLKDKEPYEEALKMVRGV